MQLIEGDIGSGREGRRAEEQCSWQNYCRICTNTIRNALIRRIQCYNTMRFATLSIIYQDWAPVGLKISARALEPEIEGRPMLAYTHW
jgi:hypothetical protein